MTTARYRNYRRALAWIDMLEAPADRPDAHDVLRQCAEDLLLTREPWGDEDPIEAAAGVLTTLVATGGCSRVLADTIMECLHESGPQPAPAADRRVSLQSTPL